MVERTITMTLSPQPEETRLAQLIAAARHNPQMFGDLYQLYVQPVYRYLYSRLGSAAEAEDVTAQTFLAALERFPKYRHEGYFAGWLFSIAHHKALDHYRKGRNETSLEEAEHLPVESDLLGQLIKTERIAILAQLIRALPEEEQELICLRYVAELSFAEIGQVLNQKEDTVKKTLYRLLARLKVQADQDDPQEAEHA
jgi:RNA polymerase sigma-70 factor (ECF subfamily)